MFVDTNIFLLSRHAGHPESIAARGLLEQALNGPERAFISRQVVREYLAAATRGEPRGPGRSMSKALSEVGRLMEQFEILEEGQPVTSILMALCREVPVAGGQIYDANIVATMLAHGESRLATRNEKDFRRYGDRIEFVRP